MRTVFLLVLVAVVVIPEAQGSWWRRRVAPFFRDVWQQSKGVIVPAAIHAFREGKRDPKAHDVDQNGFIELSEAQKVFDARDAEDIMSLADENGDSKVSVEEWQQGLEDLLDMARRAADEPLEDVANM